MWNATPMPNSSGKAMILAKLSGCPINTHVLMVKSPVNTMGAIVIATSRIRRKANKSRPQIATNESTPASMNASTTA